MQQVGETIRERIGRSGLLLLLTLILWCWWVFVASLTSPHLLDFLSPYLTSAAGLLVGLVAGAFLRWRWQRDGGITFLVVLVVVTAISLPIYANASAAVGGLMVALAGLAALDLRARFSPKRSRLEHADQMMPRIWLQIVIAVVAVIVGMYLAWDSQAAIVLTLPVALIAVLAVWKQTGPPRRVSVVLGGLVPVIAGFGVIFLGSRSVWPDWLADGDSLSGARHTLWSDALSLWATAPFLGAGPGSFTPSSALASSEPSLAAVHSLPLQVGSELGLIGLVLLGLLLAAGLLFAARGSKPASVIAIAAWSALAVHSSIDHLEDFPIVAAMAGVVLGWAGFGVRPLELDSARTS